MSVLWQTPVNARCILSHQREYKVLVRLHWLGVALLVVSCAEAPTTPTTVAPTATSPAEVVPERELSTANDEPGANLKRLALLVGIDHYKYDIGDLNGCLNDVAAMHSLLTERYNFAKEDILVLRNEQATLHGITHAFERHLIDQAGPNTVALFYFSGHGSKVRDQDGDETDGWDETLVTHDSGRSHGHANRDLRDDALNGLLRRLGRHTPHTTVILDSCHSGTAARAGGTPKAAPPDYRDGPAGTGPLRQIRRGEAARRDPRGVRDQAQGYALISAAGAGEYAYETTIEGQPRGALTFYLTRALRSAASTPTYREVLDIVRAEVTAAFPAQHPQLEGLRLDDRVFGLTQHQPEPYVDAYYGGPQVRLQAGYVHGVTQGSVYELYGPGTRRFAGRSALTEATVEEVGVTTSVLRLSATRAHLPRQLRAVERAHHHGSHRLKLAFLDLKRSELLRRIRSALRDYGHVEVVSRSSAYDLLLRVTENGGELVLEGGTPEPPLGPSIPAGPEAVDVAVRRVLRWARWYALARIDNGASELASKIVFDVSLPSRPRGGVLTVGAAPGYLDTRIPAGTKIEISVTSQAQFPLYLHVLALSSDGSVSVVFPPPGAAERLKPEVTWKNTIRSCIRPDWQVPTRDILKILVTAAPADFRFLEQRAIARAPAFKGADRLTALFSSAVGIRSLEAALKVSPEAWATKERAIEVLPNPEAAFCRQE